ncbi:MAG TPA: hypothetical protein VF064_17770 [Pyrinomonadaceae bacterium]
MTKQLPTGQTPLGEREYEVWADDSYPPYILVVIREEAEPPTFKVLGPSERNHVVFSSTDYDEVWWWLQEDEFHRVEGRAKILEWWEQ